MRNAQGEMECRIMPSGGGCWYWEVIRGHEVLGRGLADTEAEASEEANAAARNDKASRDLSSDGGASASCS
jgi:hypothetical protein